MCGRCYAESLIVGCACAWLRVTAAGAQTGAVLSDADLVAQSDVIITGRVAGIATAFDDRTIYTYVTVDRVDVLKGWVREPQVVLKQLGGRVGDLEQRVPGQPTFARGEEVLLFLRARATDLTLSTTALWQGKWTIRRDHTWRQPVATRLDETYLLHSFMARVGQRAGAALARPSEGRVNISPREAPAATGTTGDSGIATISAVAEVATASSEDAGLRPGPPTNLTVISGATVFLSWTAPTTGEQPTSYIIEGGSAPGLSDRALFSVGPTTSWASSDPSQTPLGFTYVRIRAVNRFGAGPASNEFTFYPDNFGRTPPAPTGLRPTVSGSTVVLNWTAPSFGLEHFSYYIEAGSAPGLSDIAEILWASMATTFTATNVVPGAYFVRARVFTDRRGIPSNEIKVTVGQPSSCFAPPDAPADFVTAVSGSTVSLTWTASGGPLDSYVVEAGQAVAVWNRLDTGSSATSLQVPTVPAGSYFVRIRGKNGCGFSAPSTERLVTVS